MIFTERNDFPAQKEFIVRNQKHSCSDSLTRNELPQ